MYGVFLGLLMVGALFVAIVIGGMMKKASGGGSLNPNEDDTVPGSRGKGSI